jgi:hypothetical protein
VETETETEPTRGRLTSIVESVFFTVVAVLALNAAERWGFDGWRQWVFAILVSGLGGVIVLIVAEEIIGLARRRFRRLRPSA